MTARHAKASKSTMEELDKRMNAASGTFERDIEAADAIAIETSQLAREAEEKFGKIQPE